MPSAPPTSALPGSPSPEPVDLDGLTTPLAWTDAGGAITGVNPAFARWLAVSTRRLLAWSMASLDGEGRVADALARLAAPEDAPVRLRRVRGRYPEADDRFADLLITRRGGDGGWLLEAHPVDEFPGDDPALLLPSALSASLKGLAHELRNPLAGLKGAAQLLARRVEGDDAHELLVLIDSEVARLTALLDH